MSTYLLDANVVIALTVQEHEHHALASAWFAQDVRTAYLCPIVEGALLRFLVRVGEAPSTAFALLDALHDHPTVEFRGEALSYRDIDRGEVRGYRQLTDAYLVALAGSLGAVLATFDRGLAQHHPSTTLLLGSEPE
ncbi:MAG: PIN domain-containing protein [Propioniciclava sp.]|uniref:TA system VapC family ribonuclease toxin n=1 Tax=Propioniciclava sp. TaxID=2038686 RepID=UPI0039E37BA2